MSQDSKLQRSIRTIEWLIQRKRKRVRDMEKRTDLNENQKVFIGDEYELIDNVETLIAHHRGNEQAKQGLLPPQDIDMENAVLGAIILEKHAISVVRDILRPEHFHVEANRIVYETILSMEGIPIDMRSVVVQARQRGVIQAIGGAHYIAELAGQVSSSANIGYHVLILIENAMRRKIILACSNFIQDAYDDTIDIFTIIDQLHDAAREVKEWTQKQDPQRRRK